MKNTNFHTAKIANGEFDVYFAGQKTTWRIINTTVGGTRADKKTYGVYNTSTGKIRLVGALGAAKKVVEYILLSERNMAPALTGKK